MGFGFWIWFAGLDSETPELWWWENPASVLWEEENQPPLEKERHFLPDPGSCWFSPFSCPIYCLLTEERMQFVPLLLLVRPMKSLRFLLAASQQVNLLSFHRRGEETQNSWVKDKNRSHSVVSDSLQTPWTIQSIEFSRPEYLSG